LWNSPLKADVNTHIIQGRTSSAVAYIGLHPETPYDNPADNIFHLQIDQELCGDEEIWLEYETYGLASSQSVTKSINDEKAFGGQFIKLEREWKLQREKIHPEWLKEGDNVIRFTVPQGAQYGYRLRNLKLKIEEGNTANLTITNFNQNDNQYYIRGFVKDLSSTLRIEGQNVKTYNGAFEAVLDNVGEAGENNLVHITVETADGTVDCFEFEAEENICPDFTHEISAGFSKASRFFNTGEGSFQFSGASFSIPDSAILVPTEVSITNLRYIDIPPMDAGMYNVTSGTDAFRFLPHGTQFYKEAKIALPIDEELIPEGYTEEDVRTFYFDEQSHHWVPLPKDTLLAEEGVLVSRTTHFTDMINGVIQVPESPEVNAYNSTSMKGIKAANPTAGINLMQPPSANAMGNANMNYPINIPAGRNGMQPQLAISYNNAGGNSWMGLGWNLSIPSITIDTRWGVPRYDAAMETETYSMSGQQLTPVAHRGELENRESEKQFYPRVEGGFQKIIRHGSSPQEYWWEVTDKSGVRYFYGATSDGFDETKVLNYGRSADPGDNAENNIAHWALGEIKDLNGNTVRYHYDKEEDSGVGNGSTGSIGYELYISKITYTGYANEEGPYSVEFIHNDKIDEENNLRRADVSIDGRLGFKRVTSHLLQEIKVKLNEDVIRSYEFTYGYGAFYKTLLQKIEEFDSEGALFTTHDLDYYDDVNSGSGYEPFKSDASFQEWNLGGDGLRKNFITPEGIQTNDINEKASAISGTGTDNFSAGLGVYVGLGIQYWSKTNSVGGSFNYGESQNNGINTLLDINGDGLVDKVYIKNDKFYFKAQLIDESSEAKKFDDEQEIALNGFENFMHDKSISLSGALEAYPGPAFVSGGYSRTKTKTDTYFTDANGDGLIDIVSKGTVYFNYLVDGLPTFSTESADTPNPVFADNSVVSDIVEIDPEELEKAENQSPLHDVVRMWRAPYSGIVDIKAPVQLLGDAGNISPQADGVKVSIQKGNNLIWLDSISENDFGIKNPTNTSDINIEKGDKLYFRVQSRYNGTADSVRWNPEIIYQDAGLDYQDANGKSMKNFRSSNDFLLAVDQSFGTPIDGKIRIESELVKEFTSDDIIARFVKINDGYEEVLWESILEADSANNIPFNQDIEVNREEEYAFQIISDSEIDWVNSTVWEPYLYYVESYDTLVSELFDQNGKPLIELYPIASKSLFSNLISKVEPIVLDSSVIGDTLTIFPNPDSDDATSLTGHSMHFTIKSKNKLLSSSELSLEDSVWLNGETFEYIIEMPDTLFVEYWLKDLSALDLNPTFNVSSSINDSSIQIVPGVAAKSNVLHYGNLYRGWGQFVYNGNGDRADATMNEDDLKLSDAYEQIGDMEEIPEYEDGEEVQASTPFNPTNEIFIPMGPRGDKQVWNGVDNETYLNGSLMSSSRYGDDNLSVVLQNAEGAGSSLRAVEKISVSNSITFAGGAVLSANTAIGNNIVKLDYMDLNGDRYPDIVSERKVQYTNFTGGLDENAFLHGFDSSHVTHTINGGASYSAGKALSDFVSSTGGVRNAVVNNVLHGISPSVSAGAGSSSVSVSWIDVNGDGLQDKITKDGVLGSKKVCLNLGYSFADPEDWNDFKIQNSTSVNASLGLGFSVGQGNFTGGVSLSASKNNTQETLLDVNGDGLPDKVEYRNNNDLNVYLNTGGNFSQDAIVWKGAGHISKSNGANESANAAFTFGFPIIPPPLPPVKMVFNISGSKGQGITKELEKISDVDGDGFPDYIRSSDDGLLEVKRSTIARTNMLKTVERPLGAAFTLDYKKYGNTYDHPSSLWALSSVSVFDGHTGDGVDSLFTSFEYEDGYYDRHEREFYGFQKVISNTLAEETAEKPYTQSIRTFKNDNYYEKGLLVEEVMTDGDGNLYMRKTNEFDLLSIENGNPLPANFAEEEEEASAFPALKSTVSEFYEGTSDAGKTLKMHYDYDAIGNVTQFIDEADDQTTEDDLTATIEYWDYATIKNAAKSIEVTANGKLYRKRTAEIEESTGNLKNIKQYLTDSEFASYDFEYDDYGNLTKVIRPENAEGQRFSIDYKYDEVVKTYPIEVSNSYGYSSEATYDYRYGQVLESIDLNGNKITNELDAVGRISKITGPYEQQGAPFSLSFEYHPEAETPWALTQHYDSQNRNNYMETATFVDGLGRVLQTKKDVAIYQGDGRPDQEMMVVSGKVNYDAFGRVVKAFYPILEDKGNLQQTATFNEGQDDIKATETEYDVLNRAIKVTLPDLAITETSYGFGQDRDGNQQFKTTTTDANGVVTEQFTDGKERVTAVKNITEEGNVWTSFDYNPMSEQIAAINDLEHVTESEYDLFGRRTKRIHPDAGETNYNYDLSGNLTSLVTANLAESGGAITYKYDFNRLTDIEYPENTENNVHYTYGEAGADFNRAGRIVLQEDASGAQEFFYGALGEVVKNIRTVIIPQHDEQTFETQWEYDSWNRLLSMVYPDGEEVTYTYNEGGLLRSMEGKKQGYRFNYVEQLGYDKFEQRVFLAYGNGTKTNYTYEAERRRLKGMTAETAAGRAFMDNAYSYDKVNNILNLENKAEVPTSDLMGGSSSYTYEYDDLYRLTTASGQHTGSNHKDQYSLEMSYNTVGGILNKNQFHERSGGEGGSFVKQGKTTYELDYTYGTEQPNAPTQIGENTYTYDANGNQTGWKSNVSGQERKVLWDEENRIRSIADNGAAYHYVYDASGERVLKSKTTGQAVFKNGEKKAGNGSLGNFTVYVNPYIVLQTGGYTKHYFIEGQRIVSKIGGGIDGRGQGPLKAGNDKIDYAAKAEKLFEGIVRNEKFIDEDGNLLTAGKSGKVPPGQIIGNNGNNGQSEPFRYFYHPDHLGSTSYITDATGEVYQHLEYFAFGETFVEEQGNTDKLPYKFNGKELDEETGLYYYGARYMEPQISIMLSVDRYAEKYPGMSSYSYVGNNPINYTDPTGDTIVVNQKGYIVRNDETDLLVFSQGKEGELTSLGELGKDVDVNNIYSNLLDQNAEEANNIWNPFTFRNKVKGGGEWDLKANSKTIFGLANIMANEGEISQTQFLFEGERMEAQDIGNHHFGVVGKAYGLFTEQFMLKQAGEAQMNSGTSKPEWQKYKTETFYSPNGMPRQRKVMLPPYGDDPRDQRWIKSGFRYYDNN
jgi:RHS repeat-associated protein